MKTATVLLNTLFFTMGVSALVCTGCSLESPPPCVDGQVRCENNTQGEGQYSECINKEWSEITVCKDRKGNITQCEIEDDNRGKCPEGCEEGEKACEDDNNGIGHLYTCVGGAFKVDDGITCKDANTGKDTGCASNKECPSLCTPGDRQCKNIKDSSGNDAGTEYYCNEQGIWETTECVDNAQNNRVPCDPDNPSYCPNCKEGTIRCKNGNIEKCNDQGKYEIDHQCTDSWGKSSTCKNDTECEGRCTDGEVSCVDEGSSGAEYTCIEGEWDKTHKKLCKTVWGEDTKCNTDTDLCPESCENGSKYCCMNGENGCLQNQLYTCTDGVYRNPEPCSGQGTTPGKCKDNSKCDFCESGETSCTDPNGVGTYYTCNQEGNWSTGTTCKGTFGNLRCSGSVCAKECELGTQTCRDSKLYHCSNNNNWDNDNTIPCEFGCKDESSCNECKENDTTCEKDSNGISVVKRCYKGEWKITTYCMACDDNKKGCKSNFECLDKLDYCLNLPNNEGILNFKCDRNIYGDISTDNIESSGICTKNHHYIKDVSNACQKDGDYYRCIKDNTKFNQGLVQVCENGNWSKGTRCNDKYKVCADDEGNCMHCLIDNCKTEVYVDSPKPEMVGNTKSRGHLTIKCINDGGYRDNTINNSFVCENNYECLEDQKTCGTCSDNISKSGPDPCATLKDTQQGYRGKICEFGIETYNFCRETPSDNTSPITSCDKSTEIQGDCGECLNGTTKCQSNPRYAFKYTCSKGMWSAEPVQCPTKYCNSTNTDCAE